MRCPNCNKFVSFDEQEPEVSNDSDEGASISTDVRIVNACAECGEELKEYTFDVSVDFDAELVAAHEGDGHELSWSVDDAERDTDSYPKPKEVKDRKTGEVRMKYPSPRYTRTLYGFTATAVLSCTCSPEPLESLDVSDYIEASSMDELA